MARKALSATKQAQNISEERNLLMARAVLKYRAEQEKGHPEKKRGLRGVCKDIEDEYFKETRRRVILNHNTLANLVKGGRMMADVNAEKGWLLPAEKEIVLDYTIETAEWGFPFSHLRLKEHVDAIVASRLKEGFPATGVGKQWTHRFVEKHSDRIQGYKSRPLDTARGRAVNPNTNEKWQDVNERFTMTGDDGNPMLPENEYAVDEVGFQPNGGSTREIVIGAKGKKIQYQKQDGTRENITVLVTICADGTALSPVVIYKGKHYLVKWAQDNPSHAAYVHLSIYDSATNETLDWVTQKRDGQTASSALNTASGLTFKHERRRMDTSEDCTSTGISHIARHNCFSTVVARELVSRAIQHTLHMCIKDLMWSASAH